MGKEHCQSKERMLKTLSMLYSLVGVKKDSPTNEQNGSEQMLRHGSGMCLGQNNDPKEQKAWFLALF